MVGVHLLLLLIFEVTLYGAAARHVFLDYGWSVSQALAFAVGLYLGVRALFISTQFALARWQGDPLPPALKVTPSRIAFMCLRELAGWIFVFSLVLPFIRARRSVIDRSPRSQGLRKIPVLLLHGLACNRGSWLWLRRQLEERGYLVFTMDLWPPFIHIGKYAPQIAAAVDKILDATGAKRLVLIGHSMGGVTTVDIQGSAGLKFPRSLRVV